MHTPITKVENLAQVSSCLLKFVHRSGDIDLHFRKWTALGISTLAESAQLNSSLNFSQKVGNCNIKVPMS